MEKDTKINKLYHRFLNNEASATELVQLLDYFKETDEQELRNLILQALQEIQDDQLDAKRASHLANLSVAIMNKIGQTDAIEQPASKPLFFKLTRSKIFKIAASIAIIAFLGYLANSSLKVDQQIKPGGNYATLINAEGKEFDLSDANPLPASECCVSITKTNDGRIIYTATANAGQMPNTVNKITTPMGGHYKITLSDGSLVMLNSGSSLEFPVGFNGSQRKVKLTGEGYFEITKNAEKPFIVEAGTNEVEVLGTKFNISSYDDDQIWSTTLLEGKIRFKDNKQYTTTLKPGEQLHVENGKAALKNIDAEEAMAWKDGKFIFKNEDLATVMHKISRWYNVEVAYNKLPDRRLYAKISMDASLNEVLRMISLTSNLKFKVEGRRITLIE
ncbi:FecR family protein [Pedobacter sp. N23S346]|uniref:FecR family protein n=1 Tax=Pedobacter sp. N23S346 TaxID=3402750 RepID=UPI003AD02084